MDRNKLGKAAELIFAARCLLSGHECFFPMSGGKIDVAVGGSLRRCQVKVITDNGGSKGIILHSVARTAGVTTISRYTAEQVDFMVGVDTTTFDVFIVPIEIALKNQRFLSVSAMQYFKDAFDLLDSSTPLCTFVEM